MGRGGWTPIVDVHEASNDHVEPMRHYRTDWTAHPSPTPPTAGDILATSFIMGTVLISHAGTGEVLESIDLPPGEAGQVHTCPYGGQPANKPGPNCTPPPPPPPPSSGTQVGWGY